MDDFENILVNGINFKGSSGAPKDDGDKVNRSTW